MPTYVCKVETAAARSMLEARESEMDVLRRDTQIECAAARSRVVDLEVWPTSWQLKNENFDGMFDGMFDGIFDRVFDG